MLHESLTHRTTRELNQPNSEPTVACIAPAQCGTARYCAALGGTQRYSAELLCLRQPIRVELRVDLVPVRSAACAPVVGPTGRTGLLTTRVGRAPLSRERAASPAGSRPSKRSQEATAQRMPTDNASRETTRQETTHRDSHDAGAACRAGPNPCRGTSRRCQSLSAPERKTKRCTAVQRSRRSRRRKARGKGGG